MARDELIEVRLTGLLVESADILIVKQTLPDGRKWSLPGGRLRRGETLEAALTREISEETGLGVTVGELVYVCDKLDSDPPVLHVTFLVTKVSGQLTLPTNEFDENPIYDVRMVRVSDLTRYGFSQKFSDLAGTGFPNRGYRGAKTNIGL